MKTSAFAFALSCLISAPLAHADCALPQERDPEALYNQLNEFAITTLKGMDEISLKAGDVQAQASLIRQKVSERITAFEADAKCLLKNGAVKKPAYDDLMEESKLLRKLVASQRPNGLVDAKLDEEIANNGNDPTGVYPVREHNQLTYLDKGNEHRDAIFETIRSANLYTHMSYFEFYPDRMGTMVMAALVAKRMGKKTPCEIARVADALGVAAPLNRTSCADEPLVTGPLAKVDFPLPKKDDLIARAKRLYDASSGEIVPFEMMIYLDNSKQNYHKLEKAGVADVLKLFGVKFLVEGHGSPINIWNNNHTKITANEHRAVISGGNPVDKVMDWTTKRIWRDAAILVQGELVNDINHFFLAKFLAIRHKDLNAQLCPGETKSCLEAIFPADNIGKEEYTAPGRLVWTSNFDAKISPTFLALKSALDDAQRSLYFENAFFSDGTLMLLFQRKAREWNLRHLKEANSAHGEKPTVSTCGKDYFEIVKHRPGGRYMLFVLPKDSDQIFVKLSERVLTSALVANGVDVCKWTGKLDNKNNPQADGRFFNDKTMMHSKVFMVDDERVYIGTANLNRRSMLGKFDFFPGFLLPVADLEIGVLSADPALVQSVHEKMFNHDIRATEPVQFHWYNWLLLPLQVTLNAFGFT